MSKNKKEGAPRVFKKGDSVRIGKFSPLSTFSKYTGQKGVIDECLEVKCMGYWTYSVKLHNVDNPVHFTERYILKRPAPQICECGGVYTHFRPDSGRCEECIEYDEFDLHTTDDED